MEENKACDRCKNNVANHVTCKWWETPDTKYLCCKCYVLSGSAPADWHPLCMETYKTLKPINTY